MNEVFRKTIKPVAIEEFLDYYFYRRLAALLVPHFIRFNFSPNQVTTLSLAFGLMSAVCAFRLWFLPAAFLALVAIVLDCCDGQIARLTGRTNPLGRILDGFFDAIWLAALWSAIYFSGHLQTNVHGVLPLIVVAGVSTLFHCWRFDAAKLKYLERVQSNFHEGDLDVPTAKQLLKSEWKAGHYFLAFLMVATIFQMYFFVRGSEKKKVFNLSDQERCVMQQQLEPIINRWSFLGEGHHNSLLIAGLIFAPWTHVVLLSALWIICVPVNLWWIFCEVDFWQALRSKRSLAT